ncbi:MAG: methyltransferase domain-containing protein [Candidatus Bathyarchaeota archaeon]|nr:methyltransferase domain-containing protein [Candidatus Bathyarchaeota archaeon]
MQIPYEDIFRNSDIFNPVSQQTLLEAGKLAGMSSGKTVLDLGCGRGFPSLLWASLFGVSVDGYDLSEAYVEYANARAKLLGFEGKARYFCQDLQTFHCTGKYDFVASLGIELSWLGGGRTQAFNMFKSILKPDGAIILTEPIWRQRPVPPHFLKALGCNEDSFLTLPETKQAFREAGLEELGCFVSSKQDWELYARPIFVTMNALAESRPELAEEVQGAIDGFKAETGFAGEFWDVVLWVLKPI